MRSTLLLLTLVLSQCWVPDSCAQTLEAARNDQIIRMRNYILDSIQPSGMVRDSLVLNGSSFHPASPDAAGFALVALSALDHVNSLPNAEDKVIDILSAYTGNTPGVNPERSTNGHFYHWLDNNNGGFVSGWTDTYSPIGSALIVAGAQFAKNHFPNNSTIASLTDELTNSIDFNAAIHPSLDGRIYLRMNQDGTGTSTLSPWNEYMLVESLALRQANNDRAVAVKHLWLEPDNLPKANFGPYFTLANSSGTNPPAFWVQQQHFFNGDFIHNEDFEAFNESHRLADKLYTSAVLGETDRYGLTAGVSPQGYSADRIGNHPNNVFSPEAVAAWGDMDAFLEFYNNQFPTTDPRYKYGVVRESQTQPTWVPNDAGLVDHTFLLFGLIESIHPDFFC